MKAAAKKDPVRKEGRFVNGIRVPAYAKLESLGEIRPFPDNPREHPEEEIEALAAFMMEVGFIVPIVIDGAGNVAAGHARLLAAQRLGMDRVPVLRVEYLSKKQRLAFIIADNKLPMMARWNAPKLGPILETIQTDYPDLRLVGFSEEEVRRIRDDLDRIRLEPEADRPRSRAMETKEGPSSTTEPEEESDLVSFSVLLTPDEREEVYRAIGKVKERGGTAQSSVALMTIIREWTS